MSSSNRDAHYILNKATEDDLIVTAPVFETLRIKKNVATLFLDLFEATCDKGKGSVEHLRQALRINKNDNFFFDKTFGYFSFQQKNTQKGARQPQHLTFTCPQFCFLLWWFLSLSHTGLVAWKFRVYFGGDNCAHHLHATQEQVFHMLDVLYGISKVYDYRQGSETTEKFLGTGNSHAYDVKRTQALVKQLAVVPEDQKGTNNPKKVMGIEQFQLLVQRTPLLISRIFAVQHFAREICGGVKAWRVVADDNNRRMLNHEDLENKINLVEANNAFIFRNEVENNRLNRRESFSHKEVVQVRRSRLGSSNDVVTMDNDARGSGEAGNFPNDVPQTKAVSVYHHLDFGNPDRNGKYVVKGAVSKTTLKRKNSYVANVGDNDFTGPAHAHLIHQESATNLQRATRGMLDRKRAKHLAKHNLEAAQARERAEQRRKQLH
jgi:hypothetical protein